MREKPPVLKDIFERWSSWEEVDCESEAEARSIAVERLESIAEAQRDADLKWLREEIIEMGPDNYGEPHSYREGWFDCRRKILALLEKE